MEDANAKTDIIVKAKKEEITGPDKVQYLRLGAIGLLFLVITILCFALGGWIAGIVFAVVTVSYVLVCWFIGVFVSHFIFVVRPKAKRSDKKKKKQRVSVGDVVQQMMWSGPTELEIELQEYLDEHGIDPNDPEQKEIDRVVGPQLALESQAQVYSGSALTREARDHIRDEALKERMLVYEWSKTVPDWEKVTIINDDDITFVGHILYCNGPDAPWVIYAHGYKGSWLEVMMYARTYAEHGYNLLAIEQRNHGASGGDFSGMGYLERRDMVQWCTELAGGKLVEDVKPKRIILHGCSMGGATVDQAAGEPDLPGIVWTVISDSAFSRTWDLLFFQVQENDLPPRPLLDLSRMHMRLRKLGFDFARGDAAKALEHASARVLLFQGEEDPIVPPYMGGELAAAAEKGGWQSKLVMIPNCGHFQGVLVDREMYFKEIFDLIDLDVATAKVPKHN